VSKGRPQSGRSIFNFLCNQVQYDFETIGPGKPFFYTLLAELSGFAYSQQGEIEKKLVEIGYTGSEVVFFQTTLTAGFVIELPNVVVVVFRGSHTRREWLNNLNVYLSRTVFGRIHAGFRKTTDEIAPTLVPIVEGMRGTGKVVFVTGHSRGGALASLFATLLLANNIETGVVTFGSPKVGDVSFENNFRAPVEQLSDWIIYIPGPIAYVMTVVGTIGFLIWWLFARYYSVIWRAAQRRFATISLGVGVGAAAPKDRKGGRLAVGDSARPLSARPEPQRSADEVRKGQDHRQDADAIRARNGGRGAHSPTVAQQVQSQGRCSASDPAATDLCPPARAQAAESPPWSVTVLGKTLLLKNRRGGGLGQKFTAECIPAEETFETWTLMFASRFSPGATGDPLAHATAIAGQISARKQSGDKFANSAVFKAQDSNSAAVDFLESEGNIVEHNVFRYFKTPNGLGNFQIARRIYLDKIDDSEAKAFVESIQTKRNEIFNELFRADLPVSPGAM
jgi:hypothetical protein